MNADNKEVKEVISDIGLYLAISLLQGMVITMQTAAKILHKDKT